MRYYAQLLLVISYITSQGQDSADSLSHERLFCWRAVDVTVNRYADSLNFWSPKLALPEFLFDAELDWTYLQLFTKCSKEPERVSLRRAIFDRVLSVRALKAIVHHTDSRLDMKYDPEQLKARIGPSIHSYSFPIIPHMQLTTRDLAKRRLSDIERIRYAIVGSRK
jgi:hypothetical protein